VLRWLVETVGMRSLNVLLAHIIPLMGDNGEYLFGILPSCGVFFTRVLLRCEGQCLYSGRGDFSALLWEAKAPLPR